MRPIFDATPFRERRQQLVESLADGLVIIPGAPAAGRNQDGQYVFRQRSDFFFLTGFDEADAVAVINPTGVQERFVLFVRPRDRDMEIWNGHRAGTEGAITMYDADAAYPIAQLEQKLREYMIDCPTIYYTLGNAAYDPKIIDLLTGLRPVKTRGQTVPVRLEDPSPIIHELRLRR
jgi:Xaa-Pro aminopeptidase